jgi:hypothetical protein
MRRKRIKDIGIAFENPVAEVMLAREPPWPR